MRGQRERCRALFRAAGLAVFCLTAALACRGCKGSSRGYDEDMKTVEGLPFSVTGTQKVDIQVIRLESPLAMSFSIPVYEKEPLIKQVDEHKTEVDIPRGKVPVGGLSVYFQEGSGLEVQNFFHMLGIMEKHWGQKNTYLHRLLKEEGETVHAFKGKTKQGYPYVYYNIVMEPDLVMLAVQLPSGYLVFDRSGYMRADTIPSSLDVTE